MKEIEMQPQVEYDTQSEMERAVNNFAIFWKKQPMNEERHYLGLPEADNQRIEEIRQELNQIVIEKAHEQRESW